MRLAALALLVLVSGCKAPAAARAEAGTFRSPEELARHAFESLRAGDEYAWERAVATDDELGELAAGYGTPDKNTLLTRIKEERAHALSAFRFIRDSVGDWTGTALEKVEAKTGEDGRVTGSDVALSFTRGDTRWLVRLDDCVKTKRGWVIAGTPRLEKL